MSWIVLCKSSYGDTDNMKAKLKKVGSGVSVFSLILRRTNHVQPEHETPSETRGGGEETSEREGEEWRLISLYINKYFQEEQKKMEKENQKTENEEGK